MKMHVKRITWENGEIEITLVDGEGRAVRIQHTVSHHIRIQVGYSNSTFISLWEVSCVDPKTCYTCIRIPFDWSTCVTVDNVQMILYKLSQYLDKVKVEEALLPIVEKIKNYIKEIGDHM